MQRLVFWSFFQLRRGGCTHSMNNVVGCSGFESTTRVRSRSRPIMIKWERPITWKLLPHIPERLGLGGASSRVTTSWGWRVRHYDGPTNAIVQVSTAPSGYSSCLSKREKALIKNSRTMLNIWWQRPKSTNQWLMEQNIFWKIAANLDWPPRRTDIKYFKWRTAIKHDL